jgi:hypothetical protein
MGQNKDRVVENFQTISQTALWDEELPISFDEYKSLIVAEDTEALFQMLEQEDERALRTIDLTEIMKMPFERAQKSISKFSLAKRIEVLEDVESLRSFLYSQASRYGVGNPMGPDSLSPKDWRTVMGRIKHLEIVQAWLYGI